MKHILLYKIGKTESVSLQERGANQEKSHEYLISEVAKYLRSAKHPQAADFVKTINDLKKIRVKADYADEQIDYDKGRNSILLSEQSNKILRKVI